MEVKQEQLPAVLPSKQTTSQSVPPVDVSDVAEACFENDRDRLREFLISWFDLSSSSQSWSRPGMSFAEKLWAHFYSSDLSGYARERGGIVEH